MLTITKIEIGAFDTNCYVVWTKALNALIIDPGADAEAISKIISRYRLTVRAYLITHGHMDHISALELLWTQVKAPIAMHGADAEWAFGPANQMPPYFSVPRRPGNIKHILKGGEKWEEDGFRYEVIATPGHSPGSVCFYFPDENTLFSGDTLFQDSVGRTDLPGGDMRQLTNSLRILAVLPPLTKVYPGHGPETTIAREIESNPFLKIH
ncbi:MAG: MBL fold metallo-hydrolase [Kiritimatiellia bacterium]|nr:MBL fold metallo-hydrolase [Kiritimatiellia bacterium]